MARSRTRDLTAYRAAPKATAGRVRTRLRALHRRGSRVKIGLRSLTSFARLEPTFLVIGEEKCGTSALYAYLMQHPGVLGYWNKEIRYFDRRYDRGERWYRAHFPLAWRGAAVRSRTGLAPQVGEASPGYLFHPEAPARVRALLPDARLVVLVRDPAARAHSHFKMVRNARLLRGRPEPVFEQMLERDEQGILSRGRYLESLERWYAHFPPGQLLVVSSDDLRDERAATVAAVLAHLGLPPQPDLALPLVNTNEGPPPSAETQALLLQAYDAANRRLYEHLGRDLGWPRPAAGEPG